MPTIERENAEFDDAQIRRLTTTDSILSEGPAEIRGSVGTVLQTNDNGNVEVPNGDITTAQRAVANHFEATNQYARIYTYGSGSGEVSLYDANNGQKILVGNEGGNVEVPNGDLLPGGGYASGGTSLASDGRIVTSDFVRSREGGPANAGSLRTSNCRIYEDSNGELVAEDSAGNTSVIS